MPSPTSKAAVTFVLATMLACDNPDIDQPETKEHPKVTIDSDDEETDTSDILVASSEVVYEDAEDFAILHDVSNLRPPDMDENEYRRLLEEREREQLKLELPDIEPPTQADLDLLAVRWFTQGVGVVAQNTSEHAFSLAVHFWSTDPDCRFTVPWKLVGPKESAMFKAPDEDCPADSAKITIKDEYGFFLDTVLVEASEGVR